MKAKSFVDSNFFIFIMAFFLGWCVYSLKLVSIIKLLGELDFSFYPVLMLIQGASLFVSMKIMIRVSEKNDKIFYLIALLAGFAVVYFTSNFTLNSWAQGRYGWAYSCAVFMLSTFIILAIDITTRMIVTSQLSLLENPNSSAHACFALEIGVIFGAVATLTISRFVDPNDWLTPVLMIVPFCIGLYCLLILTRKKSAANESPQSEKIEHALELHKQNLKSNIGRFLPLMVAIVAIALICKQLQGFAVFVGLKQWQASSQQPIAEIFSTLAIIQNTLVLLFLIPSFFSQKKSTQWTHGFRFYFLIQTASMFFISVFSFAATLIGTGILRKIIQRAFLNQLFNLLLASIPKGIRFIIKSRSQKYGQSIAYASLALLSYLAINDYIAFQAVWFITGLIALSGVAVLYFLVRRLNAFHYENIKEFSSCPFNVYEAISSCYALSNKDATQYASRLSPLFEQEKIPFILKKSLLHAIGEMRNENSINFLCDSFYRYPREDVQLQILIALNNFKHKEIDPFFLNVLKNTMYSDTQRGELKSSFCEVIAKRLPQETIKMTQDIIDSNPEDIRITGNAIDVLGSIATRLNSKEICQYLAKFLAPEYPRRIRINTIKHLYHQAQYRQQIDEIILSVHNSTILEDRCGAAYLYGVLGIKQHLNYIEALNKETNNRNATVLLSLLRLDQEYVIREIIDLIDEATTQEAMVYINQIYRLEDARLRYKIYFAMIEYYPQHTNAVLNLMRQSQKNFDEDRLIIIEEAQRKGIQISEDLIYPAS
ncbi:hypothetical protein FLL45_17715 [Aliikangiella marina]|uniref:ADP,ATP carrier protein n=1 Tax=Aliikangiella marina TaxID=1712262 RepID=A0A545T4B1_9GAMM|nr:hypothetical protein [Aliikangiella marina]TQV72006.1 hypothetical protein FLL45_17435 [Aliikangiella marina]TQV72059.1 hypothetical protein FLL45_17715 [Aliikangiella marina]